MDTTKKLITTLLKNVILNQDTRTQGTYSKYNSIDDKIDDLHYYTSFIKYGIGRTTYDASQEIRNKHLTRDEAKELVKKFDGEYFYIFKRNFRLY